MKLDLKQHTTKEEVEQHFELFKESYVYAEYMSARDVNATFDMDREMQWFNDNAPWFFPVLDRWVINHTVKYA